MADQSSVARLIEELTTPDGYGRHIDGIIDDELGQRLATLKSMLKFDATLVAHAHAVLFERLAAPEVEGRVLALRLSDHLFARSRIFRALLVSRLDDFLSLAIGHRPARPLPGPERAAAELRRAALAALAAWRGRHGRAHPQIELACRYLEQSVGLRLPRPDDLRATAAAEAAAREAEALALRFDGLAAGFDARAAVLEALLSQVARCAELLTEAGGPLARPPATAAAGAPAAAGQEDEEWEDVGGGGGGGNGRGGGRLRRLRAAGGSPVPGSGGGGGGGGGDDPEAPDDSLLLLDFEEEPPNALAAYVPEDDPAPEDQGQLELRFSLTEQLTDLRRQAERAAAQAVVEWLQPLTRLSFGGQNRLQLGSAGGGGDGGSGEGGGDQQRQEALRRRLLRRAAELRGRLDDAAGRAGLVLEGGRWEAGGGWAGLGGGGGDEEGRDGIELDVVQTWPDRGSGGFAAAGRRGGARGRGRGRGRVGGRGAARGGAAAESAERGGARLGIRLAPPRGGRRADGAENADGGSPGGGGAGARGRPRAAPAAPQAPPPPNPYLQLRDPTRGVGPHVLPREARERALRAVAPAERAAAAAARQAELEAVKARALAAAAAAGDAAAAGGGGRTAQGGLARELKLRLLQAAPVLPGGAGHDLPPEALLSHHGMEIGNHWGPVDASVRPPKARLDEMFGYTASYYVPKAAGSAPAAAGGGAGGGGSSAGASAAAGGGGAAPGPAAGTEGRLGAGASAGGGGSGEGGAGPKPAVTRIGKPSYHLKRPRTDAGGASDAAAPGGARGAEATALRPRPGGAASVHVDAATASPAAATTAAGGGGHAAGVAGHPGATLARVAPELGQRPALARPAGQQTAQQGQGGPSAPASAARATQAVPTHKKQQQQQQQEGEQEEESERDSLAGEEESPEASASSSGDGGTPPAASRRRPAPGPADDGEVRARRRRAAQEERRRFREEAAAHNERVLADLSAAAAAPLDARLAEGGEALGGRGRGRGGRGARGRGAGRGRGAAPTRGDKWRKKLMG